MKKNRFPYTRKDLKYMRFCIKCNLITVDSKFCDECGSRKMISFLKALKKSKVKYIQID